MCFKICILESLFSLAEGGRQEPEEGRSGMPCMPRLPGLVLFSWFWGGCLDFFGFSFRLQTDSSEDRQTDLCAGFIRLFVILIRMGNAETLPNNGDPGLDPKKNEIRRLINFAKENYNTSPTDSLSALLSAMTLNSGEAAAKEALEKITTDLETECVLSPAEQYQRAIKIMDELVQDDSTLLYEQGNEDILRQAFEDGSSLVCTNCGGLVPRDRWQQHQQFWCSTIEQDHSD